MYANRLAYPEVPSDGLTCAVFLGALASPFFWCRNSLFSHHFCWRSAIQKPFAYRIERISLQFLCLPARSIVQRNVSEILANNPVRWVITLRARTLHAGPRL